MLLHNIICKDRIYRMRSIDFESSKESKESNSIYIHHHHSGNENLQRKKNEWMNEFLWYSCKNFSYWMMMMMKNFLSHSFTTYWWCVPFCFVWFFFVYRNQTKYKFNIEKLSIPVGGITIVDFSFREREEREWGGKEYSLFFLLNQYGQ